jgi:hypothetical protein
MIDVDVLCDTFTTLREYIPTKDRQAAADHVFSVLSDLEITEADFKSFCKCDVFLEKAFAEYFEDGSSESDYEYNEDDE